MKRYEKREVFRQLRKAPLQPFTKELKSIPYGPGLYAIRCKGGVPGFFYIGKASDLHRRLHHHLTEEGDNLATLMRGDAGLAWHYGVEDRFQSAGTRESFFRQNCTCQILP